LLPSTNSRRSNSSFEMVPCPIWEALMCSFILRTSSCREKSAPWGHKWHLIYINYFLTYH
jgi:hypothetical protein